MSRKIPTRVSFELPKGRSFCSFLFFFFLNFVWVFFLYFFVSLIWPRILPVWEALRSFVLVIPFLVRHVTVASGGRSSGYRLGFCFVSYIFGFCNQNWN